MINVFVQRHKITNELFLFRHLLSFFFLVPRHSKSPVKHGFHSRSKLDKMTIMECAGCTLIAYGIPFSMFVFTIAHHPFRIIIAMTR